MSSIESKIAELLAESRKAKEIASTLENSAKTETKTEIKEASVVANPYAIGMSQAMKSTGDTPPLEKATINKAHEIAKSIMKKEETEEEKKKREEEEAKAKAEAEKSSSPVKEETEEEKKKREEEEKAKNSKEPTKESMGSENDNEKKDEVKDEDEKEADEVKMKEETEEEKKKREEEEKAAAEKKAAEVKAESFNVDVSADVAALLNGETLSEEFKNKAKVIFENVVINRVKTEVARIRNELTAETSKNVEAIKEGLVEKVDGYLNYVIEQWIEQNAIALESGMKSEILENFVFGLKNLFEEHYIEVPNEKFDVLGDLQDSLNATNEKLNAETAKNVELNKSLNEMRKVSIIEKATKDLVTTDAEKLKNLVEELSFEDSDSFAKKVQTIRDNYFSIIASNTSQTQQSTIVDNIVTDAPVAIDESVKITDKKIAAYADMLRRAKRL
jgi:hypothetical protein